MAVTQGAGGADRSAAEVYKERLQTAVRAAGVCVYEMDLGRQIYTFFENAEVIFGVSGEEILRDTRYLSQLTPSACRKAVGAYFSHPEDAGVIDGAFHHLYRGEPASYMARMRRKDGTFTWCKLDVLPITENGTVVKAVGVITDISEAKLRIEQLTRDAEQDSFTGLYNKKTAREQISRVLEEDGDRSHALLILDIDEFKQINDTYGHAAGDELLLAVAGRLKDSFRRTDVVSRFGGDEFMVLVRDVPGAVWLRERMAALLEYESDGRRCTASIGAALFPEDGRDFDCLFRRADKALYRSKAARGSCTLWGDA